jgi:PAS domain S-box-containing protein
MFFMRGADDVWYGRPPDAAAYSVGRSGLSRPETPGVRNSRRTNTREQSSVTSGDGAGVVNPEGSERQAAEASRSEALTRALLESAPDAMVIADAEGQIQLLNAEAERLFGYEREELVGRPVEVLIPDRWRASHRDQRAAFSDSPRVRSMHSGLDLWGRRKNGTEVPVEISLSPLQTHSGVFTIAAVRDVTDRKHAEQELHDAHAQLLEASEGRYRQILETTPEGVWRLDQDNVTDYVNGKMAAILGYTECEMLGEPISRFMDPEWFRTAQAEIAENQHSAAASVRDHCFEHKNGSAVWCRVSSTALFDRDAGVAGTIAVVSDITATKQRDAELRSTARLLTAATESMTEGLYAVDLEGQVTLMNHAAEHMLGWTEDELRGRVAHDAFHFQHQDGSPYAIEECPLTTARAAGTPVTVEDDTFTTRDGQSLPVAYAASPLLSEEGDGSVVVFRDISADKLLEIAKARERDEMSWVGRIRDALDEDRFVLYAQPIVDLRSGETVQHELLIRMLDRRSTGPVITPNQFLPAAEKYGLIGEIDRWVIGQAARLAGHGHPVEFNLSASSLSEPGIANSIAHAFRQAGADPKLVICEITETSLLNNEQLGLTFANRLTALGYGLALDDFGTGYGGLTYLTLLPATHIKIDRSFVMNLPRSPPNQHLVQAIVSLGKGFGKKTVAEGVEDQETLKLLKAMGVDYAQGYYLGRPAPSGEVFVDCLASPPPEPTKATGSTTADAARPTAASTAR